MNLTVVDNADGTGATVTVAGSLGGTVTLYQADMTDGLASASFSSAGSRVGNGNVTISGTGSFWIYGVEATTVSLVIGYRATTSAADSIWDECLDATVTRIQSLSLTGSPTVAKQKFPWNLKTIVEGIYVSPVRESIAVGPTNTKDDIGYGVQVTAFQASNHSLTSNLSRFTNWRERVSNAFRHQVPSGLELKIRDVNVEPGPVIDLSKFKDQFDSGALVVRYYRRETRGI